MLINTRLKFQKYLILTVLCLACLTLITLFFFPVYTDEILWKVIQGRYWLDGKQAISGFPSCKAPINNIPLLLVPFHFVNSLLFDHLSSPFAIRFFGIVTGLGWLFVTWLLFSRLTYITVNNETIVVSLIAFATLGVMPFLLAMSRPEQILLICMTIFFIPLLRFSYQPKVSSLKKNIFNAIIICFFACFTLSVHPRAILALPLIFLFLYRFVDSRWLGLLCMIVIGYFATVIWFDCKSHLICPNDPFIYATLRETFIGNIKNFVDLKYYTASTVENLFSSTSWYTIFMIPKLTYTSAMIPPFESVFSLFFGFILWNIFQIFVIFALIIFFNALFYAWCKPERFIHLLAIGSIWFFYFASVVLRMKKNAYEATLIIPLLALAIAATMLVERPSFIATFGEEKVKRYGRAVFRILLTLSAISQLLFLTNYAPWIFSSWNKPGYTEGQHYSINNFHYTELRQKITRAASRCGIQNAASSKHLVVDELTYFAFKKSFQPFFMTYLETTGWGKLIKNHEELLSQYHSSGMIVGCQWVPASLKAKAIREGEFCCLPAFG